MCQGRMAEPVAEEEIGGNDRPRVKLAQPKKPPYEKLLQLLYGAMGIYGYKAEHLAPVMGCSPNTARRRLENPGEFTLKELSRLSSGLNIPIDELRAAITLK